MRNPSNWSPRCVGRWLPSNNGALLGKLVRGVEVLSAFGREGALVRLLFSLATRYFNLLARRGKLAAGERVEELRSRARGDERFAFVFIERVGKLPRRQSAGKKLLLVYHRHIGEFSELAAKLCYLTLHRVGCPREIA